MQCDEPLSTRAIKIGMVYQKHVLALIALIKGSISSFYAGENNISTPLCRALVGCYLVVNRKHNQSCQIFSEIQLQSHLPSVYFTTYL